MKSSSTEGPAGRVAAVIPAAGAGVRMGGGTPKQFMEIDGRPLLALTLEAFELCSAVDAVFLVVPAREVDSCRCSIVEHFGFRKVSRVVAGGETRMDSVRRGLTAAGDGFELVVVHDGARPLVTASLIERVVEAARASGAAVAGIPARDTVKEVVDKVVTRTYDREKVWLAQTPQAFRCSVLLDAHNRAASSDSGQATDDASLVEWAGYMVVMVQGDENNIKVTTPQDMAVVKFLKSQTRDPRL